MPPTDESPGVGKFGLRTWNLDHAHALLRNVFAAGDALAPLYVVMLGLGLRPQEAFTLRWDCTDEQSVLLPASKFNSSLVTMPLGRATAAVLEQHWKATEGSRELVFTTGAGAPLNVAAMHRHLKELCQAAAIPLCPLITIRNSVADWLKSLGASDIEVMSFLRLGPRSVDVEQRYRIAQLLDDALFAGLNLADPHA